MMEADKPQGLPEELMNKHWWWSLSPKAVSQALSRPRQCWVWVSWLWKAKSMFKAGGYYLGNVIRDNNIWLEKSSEISMVKCFTATACKWQCCEKILVGYRNLGSPSRKYVFAKARPVVFLLTIDQWPTTSQCFSSLSLLHCSYISYAYLGPLASRAETDRISLVVLFCFILSGAGELGLTVTSSLVLLAAAASSFSEVFWSTGSTSCFY